MIGTIAGNYRIVEEIGVGGMGKVYRGIDLTLDREVAIKVLRPELMTKEQIVNRFRNEAMTLAKLNHPHIATLYSFFRHEEAFLMVLEFVRGERLDRRMARFGTLPPEEAIGIFRQILEAIAFAHKRGIIHRDLKPNNVMITETEEVKVMDFGIARVVGTERMTQEGLLVGTIEYMAPEQIRGHDPSPQTDIYSLGIMLYEMMTSRLPFTCKSQYEMMRAHIELAPLPPSQFVPDIQPHIEEAMMKALAKEPAERFATVEHFHAALLGVDPSTFAERPLRQTVQSRTLDPALRSLASDQFSSASRSTPNTGAPTTPASGQHAQPVSAPGAEPPARPFYTRPAVLAGAAAALVLVIIAIVLALRPAPSVEPQPTPAPAARFQVDVVRIEGATFRMGRDTAPQRQGGEDFDWAAAEWPSHSMPVASFEIDRYEVTNEEYAMFVAETGTPAPKDWNGS